MASSASLGSSSSSPRGSSRLAGLGSLTAFLSFVTSGFGANAFLGAGVILGAAGGGAAAFAGLVAAAAAGSGFLRFMATGTCSMVAWINQARTSSSLVKSPKKRLVETCWTPTIYTG
jgi:hypothetical protein